MLAPKWVIRKDDDRYLIRDRVLSDFTVSETKLRGIKRTLGHSHPYEEMYIFTSGKGAMKIGNKSKDVQAGTILYVSGGEFHQVHNGQMSAMRFVCIFKKEVT